MLLIESILSILEYSCIINTFVAYIYSILGKSLGTKAFLFLFVDSGARCGAEASDYKVVQFIALVTLLSLERAMVSALWVAVESALNAFIKLHGFRESVARTCLLPLGCTILVSLVVEFNRCSDIRLLNRLEVRCSVNLPNSFRLFTQNFSLLR